MSYAFVFVMDFSYACDLLQKILYFLCGHKSLQGYACYITNAALQLILCLWNIYYYWLPVIGTVGRADCRVNGGVDEPGEAWVSDQSEVVIASARQERAVCIKISKNESIGCVKVGHSIFIDIY